ncbi:MAG: adenosylcobinamide-GDP ribazoletransferase [Pseudobacteriovorax sp.]|nr:adenosylcobinamide-GDP ribazoletransferase [Pseudobacteriovorax sp.]
MKKCWRQIKLAIVSFTRIPINISDFREEDLRGLISFWPIIGLLSYIAVMLAFLALDEFVSPLLISCVLVIIPIIISGALHEDGFADFFDGLGASNKEKALAAMKDSRLGTFGVLALIANLGIKFIYYQKIIETELPLALILFQTFIMSRYICSIHISGNHLSSNSRFQTDKVGQFSFKSPVFLCTTLSLPAISFFLQLPFDVFFITSGAMLAISIIMKLWVRRRLGCFNGDCFGFVQQSLEILSLIVLVEFYIA